MVKTTSVYTGDLHCVAKHIPSNRELETDAPRDNQGRGESFSPTDLAGVALGTCIATTMGIHAKRKGVDLRGMKIDVTKEMTQTPPRKIARLRVEIRMPSALAQDAELEHAARTCPVMLSLHPEIEKPVDFHWGGGPSPTA